MINDPLSLQFFRVFFCYYLDHCIFTCYSILVQTAIHVIYLKSHRKLECEERFCHSALVTLFQIQRDAEITVVKRNVHIFFCVTQKPLCTIQSVDLQTLSHLFSYDKSSRQRSKDRVILTTKAARLFGGLLRDFSLEFFEEIQFYFSFETVFDKCANEWS